VSTIFPKWSNNLPTLAAGLTVGGLATVVSAVWYFFTPSYWNVGYMPEQPGGGFNHQLHAGKLGMDCRYCHTNVEKSAEANIPTVASCYGCHAESRLALYTASKDHQTKTAFVREAYAEDKSIEWKRIHKVPDYVRNFPHHAHTNAGVSCYSCHGNIARMEVVYQSEPLHMGWCLDCHRDPEPNLVPKDMVYKLFEVEALMVERKTVSLGAEAKRYYEERHIAAPENCGACHY